MRLALALFIFIHGFAHTVGFVVPWKIARLEESPYKTTVLNGKVDVGHIGIRLVGLLWLAVALAFFGTGGLVIARAPSWRPLALGVSLLSLVLCVVGLPESRIGIVVNAALIAFILLGGPFGLFDWLGI